MADSSTFGRKENLALNSRTFSDFGGAEYVDKMTVRGAVEKTALLLTIVVVAAGWSWLSFYPGWLVLAMFGAFMVGLLTTLVKRAAPITAPLYALLEGSALGGISAIFEYLYPGIVFQAVLLTFGVLFGLLLVYWVSGFRVTGHFKVGVIAATFSILLVYLLELGLELAGFNGLAPLQQGGLVGIGISLVVVCVAALNLVLDFDLIEEGARVGAPKYMEWYAAYGLMVTLIWLYLEVLRLLSLFMGSRDND